MSYILDALKKSDRERQKGKVPGLNSIHDPHPSSPGNQSSYPIKFIFTTIGIILLLSISALSWYWMKDSSNPAESSPAIVESVVERNKIPPPPTPVIRTSPKKLILPPSQPAPPQNQDLSIIPGIEDLPPASQNSIPNLQLAGHTYSETPEKRIIIINNNILREGDWVDDNIKLIEITWTGVTLDYKGERFTVDID